MTDYDRRRRNLNRAEAGASVTAGSVGATLGAAKLRDAYIEDPRHGQEKFDQHTARLTALTEKHAPRAAPKLAHALAYGTKPGFRPLVVLTGAGVTAGGAGRLEQHVKRQQAAERRRQSLAKAETEPNRFTPVTQMTVHQRDKHRDAIKNGRTMRPVPANAQKPPRLSFSETLQRGLTGQKNFTQEEHRGLKGVYEHYGATPGLSDALKAKTRPSKVHPRVHYGESVGPHLESKLDRHLNPEQTAKLRHPVVFHHGETSPGAAAAAVGAHKTTGNRGHVILNRDTIGAKGEFGGANGRVMGFRNVVNHEMAHAAVRTAQPHTGDIKTPHAQRRALGEEARADAVSTPRRGIYRRTHNVLPPVLARGLSNVTEHSNPEAHGVFQAHLHYDDVHQKVRDAHGQPHPGVRHDLLHSAGRRARSPILLAGVGAVGVHHWIKDDPSTKVAKVGGHRAPSAPVRLRVTPPPRHAARPYVGRYRKLSMLDHVKAQVLAHGPKITGAMGDIAGMFG